MYIIKVISWCDTDFAKRYTIISWLAITISHYEIGFSMCSANIMQDRIGLLAASAITTIILLLAIVRGKRDGNVGKWARGSPPTTQ
ncbi:MAG TPA: hypothetical protein DCL18_03875 [Prevotella sp.]|nr:hypothetical protein [Prevotella sp.]